MGDENQTARTLTLIAHLEIFAVVKPKANLELYRRTFIRGAARQSAKRA